MHDIVTGGDGFIGKHLVKALVANGGEPYVIDFKRQRPICGSVLEEAFKDARDVYHLAASPGVPASWLMPHETFVNNIANTASLLEACRVNGISGTFVLASSSTVYGRNIAYPTNEENMYNSGAPLSPYGISKRACEELCQMHRKQWGLSHVSLRLFSVYGRGMRDELFLARAVHCALTGETLSVCGDRQTKRDMTHVDDVCRAMLAATRRPIASGHAINIGSGFPVSLGEIIMLVEDIVGCEIKMKHGPARFGDASMTHADRNKAGELLWWHPMQKLARGVQDYVDWKRNEH